MDVSFNRIAALDPSNQYLDSRALQQCKHIHDVNSITLKLFKSRELGVLRLVYPLRMERSYICASRLYYGQ